MSTNKTTNYQLHAWETGDKFLRTEINENFGTIDTALGTKAAQSALNALTQTVNGKADSSSLTSHTGNTTVHITAAERTAWNGKVRVVTGSYTGDAKDSQTINLGETPKMVILTQNALIIQSGKTYGGIAYPNAPGTSVAIVTGGFQGLGRGTTSVANGNVSGQVYRYAAFF